MDMSPKCLWDCPQPFAVVLTVLLVAVLGLFLTLRAIGATGRKRWLGFPLGILSAFLLYASYSGARHTGVSLPGEESADPTISLVFVLLPLAIAIVGVFAWIRSRSRAIGPVAPN